MKLLPLPLDRLNELFIYDPVTGKITDISGKEIGSPSLGYKVVWVDGKLYRCHRIAWAMHNNVSVFPEIDHKNLDGSDNRIENLREAKRSDNMANTKIQFNNT